MRLTPASELEHRISRLQEKMAINSVDACLILQNADLFYFTGSIQSGALYVPLKGQPVYMIRRHHGRGRMESGLSEVVPFRSFSDIPSIIANYGYLTPAVIAVEKDVIPLAVFERISSLFSSSSFSDATPLIREVRMIKSSYEIHIMMDAAEQVHKVYLEAARSLKEGMTDLQLAASLEYVARSEGHLGSIRMRTFNGEMLFGHTFSGADSAVPAYTDTPFGGMGVSPAFGQGAGYKKIERNEPVIVDFAGSVDGYLVDQTRVFVVGKLDSRLEKAYSDMVRVQEKMELLAPSLPTWGELYDECLKMAVDMGYSDSFMGISGSQVSFIGHGLGIEIDEYPFIAKGFYSKSLMPGMAWAFEPKVVIPGLGAVGIENTYYLADDGTLKKLTKSPEGIGTVA